VARPQKAGLDYFPLDVDMDDKIKLIDAKFGVAGFGVLIKLWQIIYENGYYITWTEKELLLYKNRINADINLINDVINECLRWGIFNNDLYEKYSILTSNGIQKRYLEATKRRGELTLVAEYFQASIPKNCRVVFVYINPQNVSNNPQSKVKKSKEKEKNNNSGQFSPPTLEEVQAYCQERKNKVDPEKWRDFYSSKGWMIGKNKMKDWRAAVRTWEKDDPKNKAAPEKQYRDGWGID
jgi:hypothetical protein